MPNIIIIQEHIETKTNCKSPKFETSYRGFTSIDQELEREIAMQWFSSTNKSSFSQRNFLLKK